MAHPWKFPLYILPHGGGYVSLMRSQYRLATEGPKGEGGNQEEKEDHLAVVLFDDLSLAGDFQEAAGISAPLSSLKRPEDFAEFVRGLTDKTPTVILNPQLKEGELIVEAQAKAVELLARELPSPGIRWGLPLYLLQQKEGWFSLCGTGQDGKQQQAVAAFTQKKALLSVQEELSLVGEIVSLGSLERLNTFLGEIGEEATALAFNPTVEGGRLRASYAITVIGLHKALANSTATLKGQNKSGETDNEGENTPDLS
ncbi:MAG: hypothetical protein MPJ24_07355 [Pirellulaceae bacterium]|nr:hypothetical protein [Pirellulaceae bacterium]